MFKINGEITEKIEYCRHLESGCLQIVDLENKADSLYVNGKCFPLNAEVSQFDIFQYITDALNGVTENDIPET